jgi:hypothetical protein
MNTNKPRPTVKNDVPPPYIWARGYLIQLNNYEFMGDSEPTDPYNANLFVSLDEAKANLHEIRADQSVVFDSRNGFPRIVSVELKADFVKVLA